MIENYSQKTKIIFIVSLVISFVVIGSLFRSILSRSTPTRQQFGLYALSASDDKGNKWVLDLAKGQSVSSLKNTSVKPGQPLLIKTDVQTIGREVSLGLIVEGQAGEKYAGGAQKNGQLQPPPRFKIIDEAGKILTTGTFKYG